MARLTKAQRAALQLLRKHGGTLTIELYTPKGDVKDKDLGWSLQELEQAGIIERLSFEGLRKTYRLREHRDDTEAQ